jgi:hypothetical protein
MTRVHRHHALTEFSMEMNPILIAVEIHVIHAEKCNSAWWQPTVTAAPAMY